MSFITLHDPNLEANHSNALRRASALGGICVGKPAPHVEILVHPSNAAACMDQNSCLNKEGDVYIRGPHLMTKYWGENKAFGEGGWFNTGDVGWMDNEGCLWLLGRRKDVIKSGGENVHCYEVNEVV
jgi:acyl-activating enzyme 14